MMNRQRASFPRTQQNLTKKKVHIFIFIFFFFWYLNWYQQWIIDLAGTTPFSGLIGSVPVIDKDVNQFWKNLVDVIIFSFSFSLCLCIFYVFVFVCLFQTERAWNNSIGFLYFERPGGSKLFYWMMRPIMSEYALSFIFSDIFTMFLSIFFFSLGSLLYKWMFVLFLCVCVYVCMYVCICMYACISE